MQKTIVFLACIGLGSGSAAWADEAWTAVPDCGPLPPAVNDVIANTELWQCVKAALAQSEGEYEAARGQFLSRVPEPEQISFHEKMKRWDYDDQQACTKRNGSDFGCLVASNRERARILDAAAARCDAACHPGDLP